MGKYDKFKSQLPTAPPSDQKYQDKVDAVKRDITKDVTHSAEGLADEYKVARFGNGPALKTEEAAALIGRLGRDGIDDLLSIAQLQVTAYEQLLIESQQQEEPGWGNYGAKDNMLRFQNGGSVAVDYEPVGKVLDPSAFRKWLDKNGYGNLLTLHHKTMQGIIKDLLQKGQPEPPGTKAYGYWKITYRKPGSDE